MLALLALLVGFALAPHARGDYREIKIRELKPNDIINDNGFVELQMYSAGQGDVSGHYLRTYSEAGNPLLTFPVPSDAPNQQSQRTILIGDSFAFGRDITWNDLSLPTSGGVLCYLDTLGVAMVTPDVGIDCVSWGNFDGSFTSGTPSPVGSNAPALNTFSSLERSIGVGCPTALDGTDDTDNSAADFAQQLSPSPRSNSVTPTEVPCPAGVGTPGAKCAGLAATKTGTAGAELLVGTASRDVIAGLGGSDIIRGHAGNDVLCGGRGKDRLIGGRGRDRLLGQAGRDTCKGGPKKDIARTCETKRTI